MRKHTADPPRAPLSQRFPRIVAIGGGTGLPSVLSGLAGALPRAAHPHTLSAIVAMTDDGGSSGRLRKEFGMLPPGDIRNCLAALADPRSPFTTLLQHRFSTAGSVEGHAVGNLLLAALVEATGDLCGAIDHLSTLLSVRGRVLPATMDLVSLVAEFDDGPHVHGETAIVRERRPIRRLRLDRPARALPAAVQAIASADVVVVGPGSLYTSLLPNLLIPEIASAISRTTALRVFVSNLMTEPGETDGFTLAQHLETVRAHVGTELFDCVLVNRRPASTRAVERYAMHAARPVSSDARHRIGRARIVCRDLAWETHRGKIRHAPAALAAAVLDLAAASGHQPATLASCSASR